jgi:aminomethyltransferase
MLDHLPEASEGVEVYGGGEEKSIGTVTSLAWSPGLDRPIALAYLRTQFAIPGLEVSVGSPDEPSARAPGTVTKLPFDR